MQSDDLVLLASCSVAASGGETEEEVAILLTSQLPFFRCCEVWMTAPTLIHIATQSLQGLIVPCLEAGAAERDLVADVGETMVRGPSSNIVTLSFLVLGRGTEIMKQWGMAVVENAVGPEMVRGSWAI